MKRASQRGRRNRQRGQEFEREVCDSLSLAIGRPVKRILGQERDGGHDITAGPLRIDCKRRKRIGVMTWFSDLYHAAGAEGRYPAIVMREDGDQPVIMMSLEHFLQLAGDKLR